VRARLLAFFPRIPNSSFTIHHHPRARCSLSLALSLSAKTGCGLPPPPYARCRGLRRSLLRRRAPIRYSHPFSSLPAVRLCETEHPNPKLFGYLMPTNFSPMSSYWDR
jgi:hypothetical protein